MTIIILIVSAVVYVVSGFFTWLYFKIAYSKGGIMQDDYPNNLDIFATLFPIMNTAAFIGLWISRSPKIKNKMTKRTYNFFKIKK